MATLTRSAKLASKWTTNELEAFNITVEDVDLEQFFWYHSTPSSTSDRPINSPKRARHATGASRLQVGPVFHIP